MLVIRFSAIGDVAMSVHAVRALRKTYPDLAITVATRERQAGFFSGIPDIDFIFLPKEKGFKGLRILLKRIKAGRFDYIADIHNTLRGKIIRFVLGFCGVRSAAFDQMRAGRRRIKRKKQLEPPLRNHVLRFCDVFAKLGYPVDAPEPVREIRTVPEVFGAKTCTWAGIAPFARKEKKIYPEHLRTRLIELMSLRFGKVFVLSGPGEEKAYADSMAERFPNVVSVFGKTNMNGEVALISNMDVLVTMDSSAMHMASLTGAPFVALWGGTHPAIGYSAYGADPEKNYIQLDMHCRPCSTYGEGKCIYGDYRCLSGISPETVMEKIDRVLC